MYEQGNLNLVNEEDVMLIVRGNILLFLFSLNPNE